MDDFGDLYADLDDQVNAGVASIHGSHSQERKWSEWKLKELDSFGKEHSLGDRIGEVSGQGDLDLGVEEDGNEVAESSENSDSEDDLRIVLNEEDCSKLSGLQRLNLRNGEMAEGWGDEEEEEDDLVIVTGSDHLNKCQKWAEQLPSPGDGLVQGSATKGGFRSWYIESNTSGFPVSTRTSKPGKGDWEQVMLRSEGMASCHSGIPAFAQNGFSFSLPRNRTIFDISIEAFQQKPWREHGADITDYFNFGLNEESWKSYCQHLDHYGQQAMTSAQIPINGSSRLHWVSKSEVISTKAVSSKAFQCGQDDNISIIMENTERGFKGFEMPKGRAIQVESGAGERIPSVDIRRPRQRDSDVVIQIAMEEAPLMCNGELYDAGQIDGSCFKDENEFDKGRLWLDRDSRRCQKISNSIPSSHPVVPETCPKGTAEEVDAKLECKKVDRQDSLGADEATLEIESASDDRVLHSLSFSDLDSDSESKDGNHSIKVHTGSDHKSRNAVSRTDQTKGADLCVVVPGPRKTSVSSFTRLQESYNSGNHASNDSRSNTSKTELEDHKVNGNGCRLSLGDHRVCSTVRVDSVAESHIPTEDGCISTRSYRKCRNKADPSEVCNGTRERKYDCSADVGRHLSSCKFKRLPVNEERKRYVKEFISGRTISSYHRKGNDDSYLSSNRDERNFLIDRSIYARDKGINCRDYYLYGQHRNNQGTRSVVRENSDESISESDPFLWAQNSYFSHKKEDADEHWDRTEALHAESFCEYKFREHSRREIHRRRFPYDEISDQRSGRHSSCNVRELRSPVRTYSFDHSPCFGLNRQYGYDENQDKISRHPNHSLLDSEAYETHIAGKEHWHDASSWRSNERCMDSRRLFATREIRSTSENYEYHFAPSSKDCHHSSHENGIEFDNEELVYENRNVYLDKIVGKERYGRLAKPRLRIKDEVCFRHQEREERSALPSSEGSFLYDRSSSHGESLLNKHLLSGRKISDEHQFDKARKKIKSKKSADSDDREHKDFVLDIFDKERQNIATLERREAFSLHLNGWKRKFPRGGHDVTGGSKRNHHLDNTVKKLKDSRHVADCSHELPSRVLKSERSHSHANSLKDRAKEFKPENCDDLLSKNYHGENHSSKKNDDDEIEEGQLIEEPDDQGTGSLTKDQIAEKNVASLAVEARQLSLGEVKFTQQKESAQSSKNAGGYDSDHILETLAKMEKRRERFKEPITLKQGSEKKILMPQVEIPAATEVVKPQRPTRKRRWGGS